MQETQEIDNKVEANSEQEKLFNVNSIFKSRMAKSVEDALSNQEKINSNNLRKNDVATPNEDEAKKPEESVKKARLVPEKGEDDDSPQETSKEREIDYKSEWEKAQKRFKDTQQLFHEDRKKLAAYKKAVEKMKEDGSLLDEEASILLDHTNYEGEPEPENESVLDRYCKIWDQEIATMRSMSKYIPNFKEIDQQIVAFQHFLKIASYEELNGVLDELSKFEDDKVELTKQMLELGRQYNEDIYSDIHEAGSIRKLKSMYSKKQEELKKVIDKLQKENNKLKQTYEDYNTEEAKVIVGSGVVNANLHRDSTFDVGKIFKGRFRHQ